VCIVLQELLTPAVDLQPENHEAVSPVFLHEEGGR